MKKIKFALIGAAMAFAALVGGKGAAEAATMSPAPAAAITQIDVGGSAIVKVDYYDRGYCYRHPWRCRHHRYGYRYGYGGYPHCRRWRWECANRWGWNTHRFYRCLRYHGC
jgi:hypothetical protein